MRVGDTLQLREGYVAVFTDLYLFVRLPPRPGEIPISIMVGPAHPEDVVTERREVKIYRSATPARQNPATIPRGVDQSPGFRLFAGRKPVVKARNPRLSVFASLRGESGCRVFLEEGQQL